MLSGSYGSESRRSDMELGRIFLVVGICFLVVGGLLCLLPKGTNPFGWFGRLPGDVNYKTDSVTVWIPITSMIVVSLFLSVASWVIQKIIR